MATLTLDTNLAGLPQVPAADVKKRGWRGLMREVEAGGTLVVTNHAEPEAVIVPIEEYSRLLTVVKQAEAQAEAELDTLRRQFDARLAVLNAPTAGDRLRRVLQTAPKLRGKVKAGSGH